MPPLHLQRQGHIQQPRDPRDHHLGRGGETRLHIIRAQHDRQNIQRAMALQRGQQAEAAVHVRTHDRIIKLRCPPRQPFLDQRPRGPESPRTDLRPAMSGPKRWYSPRFTIGGVPWVLLSPKVIRMGITVLPLRRSGQGYALPGGRKCPIPLGLCRTCAHIERKGSA